MLFINWGSFECTHTGCLRRQICTDAQQWECWGPVEPDCELASSQNKIKPMMSLIWCRKMSSLATKWVLIRFVRLHNCHTTWLNCVRVWSKLWFTSTLAEILLSIAIFQMHNLTWISFCDFAHVNMFYWCTNILGVNEHFLLEQFHLEHCILKSVAFLWLHNAHE